MSHNSLIQQTQIILSNIDRAENPFQLKQVKISYPNDLKEHSRYNSINEIEITRERIIKAIEKKELQFVRFPATDSIDGSH